MLGYSFKVVNVRATKLKKQSGYGQPAWHNDGLHNCIKKIMIYPSPMDSDNGTFEIIDRQGKYNLIANSQPSIILADVAVLVHRGIPPKVSDCRPMIEITIIPSLVTTTDYVTAGHNARVPLPSTAQFEEFFDLKYRKVNDFEYSSNSEFIKHENIRNINLGGGSWFSENGWINYDEFSRDIRGKIKFHSHTELPYPSSYADVVYSSHCLEHLNDSVVNKLIREAYRVLNNGGKLVIKLPDFDAVLDEFRRGVDNEILSVNPDRWNIVPLKKMWENSGIPFSYERLAAMIFCGYWKRNGYQHFSDIQQDNSYHGPCKISDSENRLILEKDISPHSIAMTYVNKVIEIEGEENIVFNHQNAWSYKEFIALIESIGFEFIETSTKVTNSISQVPSIHDGESISRYYEFLKP
ncbi:methyltransferase domain-containing protein [Herbaspirillum sp. RTI4]|uniref:methyltransferase domain-containing protein n=1 Tax=Herbaspirillum sp. RTI4 TaxID=3048640 RepID=UPI002AB51EDE|nr:methyltransferase domain-containing protein [Herbaspirillum sp. RTI4]MDY7577038.1 methyltransferase domain-containing protein [Herbaspirillum sp. RTI4]MEA9982218.1 methyltransferase domain-containing protein [Herbaspirillum sp. RTI4]